MDERDYLRKQRQKWMAERDVENSSKELGINEADLKADKGKLLNEITIKLTEKLRSEIERESNQANQRQVIKLEKTIAQEIESNNCAICLEIMLPPARSPILLFPCGHTFCRSCMLIHTKNQEKKCPVCRKQIQSQALNLSLQNMICVYTNNKHLIDKYKDVDPNGSENPKEKEGQSDKELVQKYQKDLQICDMRYKILKEERRETLMARDEIKRDLASKKTIRSELESQKKNALDRLEKLKAELKLIQSFLDKTEEEENELEKKNNEAIAKLELIDGTLEPIEQERSKYQLIISSMRAAK